MPPAFAYDIEDSPTQLSRYLVPPPGIACVVGDASVPRSILSRCAFQYASVQNKTHENTDPRSSKRPIAVADAWLTETLARIQRFRNVEAGWDGTSAPKPNERGLDDAECLAALFATTPTGRRPEFSVDATGAPTFERRAGEFYLHLTIDGPGVLSWYGTNDGVENFGDDVHFDGAKLPTNLSALGI